MRTAHQAEALSLGISMHTHTPPPPSSGATACPAAGHAESCWSRELAGSFRSQPSYHLLAKPEGRCLTETSSQLVKQEEVGVWRMRVRKMLPACCSPFPGLILHHCLSWRGPLLFRGHGHCPHEDPASLLQGLSISFLPACKFPICAR